MRCDVSMAKGNLRKTVENATIAEWKNCSAKENKVSAADHTKIETEKKQHQQREP